MQKLFSIDELYDIQSPLATLDLMSIESLEANAGYEEHGKFRLWTELHENTSPGASGYDYSWSIGMDGDGTDTNKSLLTWETGFDTGGGWKTDEIYWTKQHVGGVPLWPTARRIGWCFSTFSTNRGNAANGSAVGFVNCDNVEFHATQPAVSGVSLAGWNYANITNNFSTGTTVVAIRSHSSNYGQCQLTLDSTGTAVNTSNLAIGCTSDSINVTWLGGSLQINGTNQTAVWSTTTIQASTAANNGAAPAAQFFNSNPNIFNFNTIDCRTLSANQIATIGFWNQNANKWRVGNNGASGVNRFVIYNDDLGSEALGIDIADNTLRFGTRTSTSDAPITGYITIKDAAGNTRKLAVID